MQAVGNLPAIWHLSLPWSFSRVHLLNPKHQKAHALHCLRSEGHDKVENSQENLGLSAVETEPKHKVIWRLFKEAQQNILFLNKQRLAAVEELEKLKMEKDELLERIDKLEAENQYVIKKDKLSLFWELLLRIDSMVINGLIDIGEASRMRKLVRDHELDISQFSLDVLQQGDAKILAELRSLFQNKGKRNGLHIVHICTEMAPLVSLGPLASYVTGLSRALQGKGHLVEVILPKYSMLDLQVIEGLREIEADSFSYFNGQLHANRMWNGVVSGIGVTLIQPYNSSLFNRDKVYGYPDDFDRFAYFSRASLDYIAKSGKQPDVLHIHNWQTAIVAPLFWDIFVNQGLEGTRILLTCQDFDSKCLVPPEKLELCGLDQSALHRLDRLQDDMKPNVVNILKGGVVYSNKVVIMPSSHMEGRTLHNSIPGLEPTLSVHKEKLLLAPFGLDYSTWDPSTDVCLPENYSFEYLQGKSVCKVELQRQLGLVEHVSSTIVGCIFSKISDIDLESLKALIRNIFKMADVQFVIMLMNEDQMIIKKLEKIKDEIEEGNFNFKVVTEHNEVLSRLFFAGSDIMLCLSFHDPILQVSLLKALRYGTAPIELNPKTNAFGRYGTHEEEKSTWFSRFMKSTFGNMSLSQALELRRNNQMLWKQKIMEAMERDFSWDAECFDVHVSAYSSIKNL